MASLRIQFFTLVMCVFGSTITRITDIKTSLKPIVCFERNIDLESTSFVWISCLRYRSNIVVFGAIGTQATTMTFSTFLATLTRQPVQSGNHHLQNHRNHHISSYICWCPGMRMSCFFPASLDVEVSCGLSGGFTSLFPGFYPLPPPHL